MKYERLLPFDDYRLRTSLSEAEVRDKIAGALETGIQPFFSFRNYNTKPYKGKLTKEGFEIRRLITYRNSFLPLIQGQIVPSAGGSTLHIRMRPHLYVLIFMSFWLGVVGLVCFGILFSLLTRWGHTGEEGFSLPLLIPFGMFAVGYGMLIGGYRTESSRSKAFLAELLSGQQTTND